LQYDIISFIQRADDFKGLMCIPHSPPHLLVPIHLPALSFSSVVMFEHGAQPIP